MHGMPNHPQFAGLEEDAALQAMDKYGNANILHGHIHGKHNQRYGKNTTILNAGDGKQGFGVYLYGNDKKSGKNKILDIFNRSYNKNLDNFDYEMIKPEQISLKEASKDYG